MLSLLSVDCSANRLLTSRCKQVISKSITGEQVGVLRSSPLAENEDAENRRFRIINLQKLRKSCAKSLFSRPLGKVEEVSDEINWALDRARDHLIFRAECFSRYRVRSTIRQVADSLRLVSASQGLALGLVCVTVEMDVLKSEGVA